MPARRPELDAREVDRVEVLATVDEPVHADAFLARCVVGSSWMVHIRTAEVLGTVRARTPLGTFDEATCTCLSLRLELPVPVEPGLRIRLVADDDAWLTASAVVRPWGG